VQFVKTWFAFETRNKELDTAFKFPVNSLIFEPLTSKNRTKVFQFFNIRAFLTYSLLIPCFCA